MEAVFFQGETATHTHMPPSHKETGKHTHSAVAVVTPRHLKSPLRKQKGSLVKPTCSMLQQILHLTTGRVLQNNMAPSDV